MEIIVSDGGSDDDTVAQAHQLRERMRDGLIVLEGPRGRGKQLAAGAAVARGDVLVFLHADCQLHERSMEQMSESDWPTWGGFHQSINDPRWRFRCLEFGNALRVRMTARVFGDQAIFVHRKTYDRVGGFDPVDLMEDVMISRRLRAISWPTLLPGRVRVDPRRWHRRGVIRQTFLNWHIQIAFARGASVDEVKQRYE